MSRAKTEEPQIIECWACAEEVGERDPIETFANCIRIDIVSNGPLAPRIVGDRWCFRTMGGTVIQHPSAYRKKGFSNMMYDSDSRRCEVGAQWIVEHCF